jgi:serine/threonine-protein kinase
VQLTSISFGLFHILQSIALSRKHIGSLARADQLNQQLIERLDLLEARHREIAHLNEELRRQIGERSRQLADTLANLSAASRNPMPLGPGDVIEGRYRVVRALGHGGMGAVYEVERLSDGRRLALKQLRGEVTVGAVARLAREAQITSTLDHPNVVSITDMSLGASGALYLVMELCDGPPLEAERGRFGQVAWGIAILRQIAAGLEAVHTRGVVHRDLKPSNILLMPGSDRERPQVKIADFGVSRLGEMREIGDTTRDLPGYRSGDSGGGSGGSDSGTGHEDTVRATANAQALTGIGVIVGTPMYIAPELSDGAHEATAASDMFSFGVIAYELLTGTRPFLRPLVLERLSGRDLPRPRGLESVAGLPEETARLLERCLDYDPAGRPAARQVREALDAASGVASVAERAGGG